MRKKRGYQRETPLSLVRDYKLFAIACEGGKREPEYFRLFRYFSRKIAVDVIEDIVSDEEVKVTATHKSSPKWVLDRAIKYIEKEGLKDEDDLWFVMDVDRWDTEQLREIALYCEQYPNWHIVLSNPCFEVWLYLHKKGDITLSKSETCSDLKHEISGFEKGGYHPLKFIANLPDAIKNAMAADADTGHFMPEHKVSKVYELGETVFRIIGKSGFDGFINKTLPGLIRQELNQAKKSKK